MGMIDFNQIDWNAVRQENAPASLIHDSQPGKERWDSRAEAFARSVSRVIDGDSLDKDDYYARMMQHVEIQPGWTVLDIGCGPGTLTIPFARKAASVTALDISGEMLRLLKSNAEKHGIANIRYIHRSWEETCSTDTIEPHDVVVASRSLMAGNFKESISRIDRLARRAVYMTFPVIHSSLDREVYRMLGRTLTENPLYLSIYTMLFQMGIMANVDMIRSVRTAQYNGIDDIFDRIRWRADELSDTDEIKVRKFLEEKFGEQNPSSVITCNRESLWALIWWRKP